jgi:hypothetical protein
MIWVDWHLGQFIDLTEIFQGSDLKFTITMHYYQGLYSFVNSWRAQEIIGWCCSWATANSSFWGCIWSSASSMAEYSKPAASKPIFRGIGDPEPLPPVERNRILA